MKHAGRQVLLLCAVLAVGGCDWFSEDPVIVGDADADADLDPAGDRVDQDLAGDVETVDFSDLADGVGCLSSSDCQDGNLCNGEEACDPDTRSCMEGTPLFDGSLCLDEPRSICIHDACEVSVCGDGFVDAGGGESCEPPGEGGCGSDCRLACTSDAECDDGHDCTEDVCDDTTRVCTITPISDSSTPCRAATGPCDAAEHCDGENPDCPPDLFMSAGTSCDDGDPCSYPDQCDDSRTCSGAATDELHDVVSLATGGNHACAVLETGRVMCWGANGSGQLGDGTNASRDLPVDVVGLSSGFSAVSAGATHTCAVSDTGSLKCWGANFYGQLGNGASGPSSMVPVDVTGLTAAVSALSLGGGHTCALLSSGQVRCWGRNDYGQLGDGTTTARSTPTAVSGLPDAVAAVSAGYYFSCALLASGGVRCWGSNSSGQLGNGNESDSHVPVSVASLPSSGVADVSCGGIHCCVLLSSGGAKCWGSNDSGQLGDGTTTSRSTPVDVSGLPSGGASSLLGHFGYGHTCALVGAGSAMCWGLNNSGQLGTGSTSNSSSPVDVTGLAGEVSMLSVGYYFTCALMASSGISCWGRNDSGQLGNGSSEDIRTVPAAVSCP